MPSLLDPLYAPLIRTLPVPDHSIRLTSTFWQPKFAAAQRPDLWQTIEQTAPHGRISRQRLLEFDYPDAEQKCAEILLWGYPNDNRGIVSRLLPHLQEVARCAASDRPWPEYADHYPKGIGMSTVTKLASFHHRHFDGHRALILDMRLIAHLPRWAEVQMPHLTYATARLHYLDFLHVMHSAATTPALNCTPEQLEFFLFALGDSF